MRLVFRTPKCGLPFLLTKILRNLFKIQILNISKVVKIFGISNNFYNTKKEAKSYQILKTYNVFYTPLTFINFMKTQDKL